MEIKELGYNFYLIRELLEEDKTRIIMARSWRLGATTILIRSWDPNFSVVEEGARMVTMVWASIRFLLVEYHTSKVLVALENLLVKTVALDAINTTQVYQVRVCIEIYLRMKFPNQIMVNWRRYQVSF